MIPTAAKVLAALVFVAGLGFVLAGPLFDSDPPGAERNRNGRAGPKAPSPEAPAPETPEASEAPLAIIYPRRCLAPVPAPEGEGSVAVAWDSVIQIGTLASVETRLRGRGPISWSPSGRFLALAGRRIYDSVTGDVHAVEPRLHRWAWSPIADCLVGTTEVGSLVVRDAASRRATEVNASTSVQGVRFSPDGLRLRAKTSDGFQAIDLTTSAVVDTPRGGFRSAPACPATSVIWAETCSPDGDLVVGSYDFRLTIANVDGSAMEPLTDPGYSEWFPEWGPRGTGIVFFRHADYSGETVEVWYFPEGAEVRRTPFTFEGFEGFAIDEFPYAGVIDWSVSPPRVACGPDKCT